MNLLSVMRRTVPTNIGFATRATPLDRLVAQLKAWLCHEIRVLEPKFEYCCPRARSKLLVGSPLVSRQVR